MKLTQEEIDRFYSGLKNTNLTTVETIVKARYSIQPGVDILAPECAVPLQTPIENLKAIVEAAKETSHLGLRT